VASRSPTSGSTLITVLAFDYGSQRIGTAVGQQLTGSAQALRTVPNSRTGPQWSQIEALFSDWQPEAFVVGLPVPADGNTTTPIMVRVRAFGDELERRFRRPVHYMDERLSSHAADQELRSQTAQGKRVRHKDIASRDSIAARLILESWFLAEASAP